MMLQILFVVLGATGAAHPAATRWIDAMGGHTSRSATGLSVDLSATWVGDTDLVRVAALPGVLRLNLGHTRITDLGLRYLRDLSSVQSLDLGLAEQITDEGVQHIKGWKSLQQIELKATSVTDSTVELLSRLPALTDISVGYARVTDTGMSFLVRLSGLTRLTIGGNRITENGLQSLRALPRLRALDLGGQQRTDSGLWQVALSAEGMAAVATLQSLESLSLAETAVTAELLAILEPLVGAERTGKLENLGLRGCSRLKDDAVLVLLRFQGLRRLDLRNSGIPVEGIERLRAAMPQTTILH
jgi:Leucine Rich repeat